MKWEECTRMPRGKAGDEVWRVCPSGFVVMHFRCSVCPSCVTPSETRRVTFSTPLISLHTSRRCDTKELAPRHGLRQRLCELTKARETINSSAPCNNLCTQGKRLNAERPRLKKSYNCARKMFASANILFVLLSFF